MGHSARPTIKRRRSSHSTRFHEHVPRRAHFDAGKLVKQYGDQGHREAGALYEMGARSGQHAGLFHPSTK